MKALLKFTLVCLSASPLLYAPLSQASPSTEGVGQGVSVTQDGGFGKHRLTWSLRKPGQETVVGALAEEVKGCSRTGARKTESERRGGLTAYTIHTSGTPRLVLGKACYETHGDVAQLLGAMSFYTSGQLLPRKNGSIFKDRHDPLRDLMKWHRSKLSEASGAFQIGPLQLERDYTSAAALLDGIGAEDFEPAHRPTPYGQPLTVFAPSKLPSLSATQLTLARAGRDTRITQFVGISDIPLEEWLESLSTHHGPPAKSSWEGKSVTHQWIRGDKTLSLESLGARSRLVWNDTSCLHSVCNAAPLPGDVPAGD